MRLQRVEEGRRKSPQTPCCRILYRKYPEPSIALKGRRKESSALTIRTQLTVLFSTKISSKRCFGIVRPGRARPHNLSLTRREFVQELDMRAHGAVEALDLRVFRFNQVVFIRRVRAIAVA